MLGVQVPSLTLVQAARWPAALAFAREEGTLLPVLAPVAQLDRASGFEPAGCAFESRRAQFRQLDPDAGPPLAGRREMALCPASSTWQSNGFLIRGLQVQFLRGVLSFWAV